MKLHYSTQGAANNRYRKIKAVATAVGLNLEDVPHQTTTDLTKISPFNTLPLLETAEGTFFSSNTIVRFLAATANKLYGNNLHNRALIDQWLDVSACDFEAAVAAVSIAKDGKQVDGSKVVQDIHTFLAVVQKHLNGKKFLVGEQLSIADIAIAAGLSVVFSTVLGQEERKAYPNLTTWYLSLVNVDLTIGSKDLPKEAHKAFKSKQAKKEKKQEPKKVQEKKDDKQAAKQAADSLFDDDDQTPAPPVVPKPEVKKKKEKPVAKSIVVFDVKVYEQETDLLVLFKKITTQIVIDGLVWNNEPKILPIAFGMNKLQIGCVIEDAKVSTQDIFQTIEGWQEVQSTDTVSFNKL